MWFKNLTIFRLHDFHQDVNNLEQQLQPLRLRPCGKTELASTGWVSPYGGQGDRLLSHVIHGYALICACKEERLLPSTVVREALEAKLEDIEIKEGREVFRKEKARIKDELIFELLPKAFTRKIKTFAYLDSHKKLLIIDTASPNRAEAVLSLLRETFGSLQAIPMLTKQAPQQILTDWVLDKDCPANIVVEDNCEMIDPKQEGAVIRCNKYDLQEAEIQQHLNLGKRIKKVAITWNDSLSLLIEDGFIFRRIRPLSILVEKRKEIVAESKEEQLDADFSLMTLEFSQLIDEMASFMGGLQSLRKEVEELEEKTQVEKAVA